MPARRPGETMTRFVLPLLLIAAPALAQRGAPIDQRVDRVERELRAVQRKVFPNGAPAFSEPEIAAPAPVAAPLPEAGGGALNALSARVDSLERELQRTTGQIEQFQNRLSIVSEQAAKDRADFDARLKLLEASAAPAAAPTPAFGDEAVAAPPPRTVPSGRPGRGAPRPARAAEADAEPVRDDRVAAALPASPATGDPAEDGYMAGYELWMQKKYPEAEAALKRVVQKYPKHRRASYAQNLLGRAYLDDGQPASAAEAFAANYQKDPKGERAPDSLYYLGQSLVQLKKQADACRVYDELNSAYGATMSASLKTRTAAARREAGCR